MATIGRRAYAEMFGPTVGDRLRLADTELILEVEADYTLRAGSYGEEVKFGGGKTIRDGMAQSQRTNAGGAVDTVLTNALVIDHTGIFKADIGLKAGRIAAIGKAGNPDTQPGVDIIIGLGGGSAMDVAKLTAALLNNDVTLRELLDKAPIPRRGLPTLMIPTTAGTGSETTPNSIVLVPEDELKVGIVSPKLMPDCVILDPKMTLGLPPAITASTGMDALCHAIECYTSKKGNPFSEMIALKAISLITRSIRRAFNTGTDIDARHDMLLGAMYGGMCIATSSTTAVHALAYPLGEAIFELNRDLQIPSDLKRWNITAADLETLVEGAAKVTRLLDNNPRPMGKADIRAIYTQLI